MIPTELSAEQSSAARSTADRLTIIAPPGCGKTEVLAHRVEFLIESLKPGQKVLALTFTNRAKANLLDRLQQTVGVARSRRYVSVENFHTHATGIILAHGRTVGLDPTILVRPKSTTLSRALQELEADPEARSEATKLLAATKRQPVDDAELLEALHRLPDQVGRDLAILVEEARQQSNQLHYEDLLRHAQRIMHVDAVAHLYRCHYGAVVVDEFQDMSLQQLDLAERSCDANRTFAGDPSQGIFSWTGAAPVEVSKRLAGQCGPPLPLHESYRSSPRVLELVNKISDQVGQSALVSAHPEIWSEEGCSARLLFLDRADEAQGVVKLARALADHHPHSSVGVIVRSAWRGTEISDAFHEAGLPVRHWDLAVDDPETLAFIREVVARLPRGATVGDARLECLSLIESSDVDTLELLEDTFEVFAQSDATTIRGVLDEIRVAAPREPVGPGVHLLSAHKGKGQQFDWVVVVGLDEGHIPDFHAKGTEALAEELRVLLVMVSRARHGVVVTRSTYALGKRPPHNRYRPDTSRWWDLLEAQYDNLDAVLGHLERTGQ